MAKTEIFSPRHRILLYYLVGKKFAQNRSISYHFEDIFNVLFSAKIQRWTPKIAKIENFPLRMGYSCTTLWVKNLLKIALPLMIFEKFTLFHFPLKSKMAAKIEIFPPSHRTLLYYPVGQKFTWNHSISYHFRAIFNNLFSA